MAREVQDAVDVEPDHARKSLAGASQTLESHVHTCAHLRCTLLDDVREHAEAGRQVESPYDLFEQLLEPHDRIDLVCGGIESDHDIAAAMRQAVEDRQENLLFVVAGAIRLNPRPEMTGHTDAVRKRIE